MAGEAVRVRGGEDTRGKGRQTGEGRRKWGVQGKEGPKLVTEQGRRKQERDGRREGNTISNNNDSKHFEY